MSDERMTICRRYDPYVDTMSAHLSPIYSDVAYSPAIETARHDLEACAMSIDAMRQIHAEIPMHAKLEPIVRELNALAKCDRSKMLRQSHNAVISAIASLEAALQAEKSAANSRFVAEAAKGQLQPRPPIRVVYED